MFADWQGQGIRQIAIETSWISLPGELTDLFPGGGGEVVTSTEEFASPPAVSSVRSVQMENYYSVPAYVRVLRAGELDSRRLMSTPGLDRLFSPKVTIFEGQTVNVNAGHDRPFVTGFKSVGPGRNEPRITHCNEGCSLECSARYDERGRQASLRIVYRHSEVVDVDFLKLRIGRGAEEVAVQIPHVSGSLVELETSLADGETLLIAPLRRDKEGRLQIGLITPRLLKE
jgi:hypothetical protein